MNRSLQLLKDHRVGIWCRRAAWIILALGLINIALTIYGFLFLYNGNALGVYNGPPSFLTPQQLISMASELITLGEFLFYFSILYAAAAVIEHLTGTTRKEDLEEEDIKIEDLEERVPEQLQK